MGEHRSVCTTTLLRSTNLELESSRGCVSLNTNTRRNRRSGFARSWRRRAREGSSRGKAQGLAHFVREPRLDRADIPVDELDDAALMHGGIWTGLISRRMDA